MLTCPLVKSLFGIGCGPAVLSQGPAQGRERLLLPHLHLDLADSHGRRRHVQVEAVAVAAFDGRANLGQGKDRIITFDAVKWENRTKQMLLGGSQGALYLDPGLC